MRISSASTPPNTRNATVSAVYHMPTALLFTSEK
jgi:hypothetical protein